MPGKRLEKSATARASSQAPPAASTGCHGACEHVPRGQLGPRIGVGCKAVAFTVDENRPGAAYRLRDERGGIDPGQLERRRVELKKLDVAKVYAGAVRQRPTVRGGDLGIRGDGIELTHAAGGQDDGGGKDRPARPPVRQRNDTRGRALVGQQRGDLRVLEQLDERVVAYHVGQGADERRTGAVAAGVNDPGPGMGGLEPKTQTAIGPPVEYGPQGEELVNSVGAFTCEDSYGLWVGQAIARGHGIGGVLARAVARAECHGDAALCPGTRAVGERFLGDENRGLPLGSETPGRPEAGNPGTHNHGAGGGHSPGNITANDVTEEKGEALRSGPWRAIPVPPAGRVRWAARRRPSDRSRLPLPPLS